MIYNRKRLFGLVIFTVTMLFASAFASAQESEAIGEFVRASDNIIYGEFYIDSISEDRVIKGKIKIIDELKGKIGKKEIDATVSIFSPQNSYKLKSDLTNLGISASEDIEASGASVKSVVAMLKKTDTGENAILRLIPLFRADKLELYLSSYREVVALTKITDKDKLYKEIKYDLGDDFSYTLYNHCIEELFNLDISFMELFSAIKIFLTQKEERKNYSWFNALTRVGMELNKQYDNVDKVTRDDFFGYLFDKISAEPIENERNNKFFLDLLKELKRLIRKDDAWKAKYLKMLEGKSYHVEGLDADHFRNENLKELQDEAIRALSRE